MWARLVLVRFFYSNMNSCEFASVPEGNQISMKCPVIRHLSKIVKYGICCMEWSGLPVVVVSCGMICPINSSTTTKRRALHAISINQAGCPATTDEGTGNTRPHTLYKNVILHAFLGNWMDTIIYGIYNKIYPNKSSLITEIFILIVVYFRINPPSCSRFAVQRSIAWHIRY